MTVDLRPADFTDFFRSVHNFEPFPWQQALVDRLAESDTWPDVLDLPTGTGKTAALDAAIFHLALRAEMPFKAAMRIALVVDRRLVVDDAFIRAKRIDQALANSLRKSTHGDGVVAVVARRLKKLAGQNARPLVVQRLRGGAPLEDDWARTPTQPTILCSTVDQVGSRLLFRGYGVSDRMKPVHAGLLGNGSLILLDEAHLSEPFRQTLEAVRRVGHAQVNVALLSATPGHKADKPFELSIEDREDSELNKRISARKPVAIKPPLRTSMSATTTAESFAHEARAMADRLQNASVYPSAVGVVVNRVALARKIFAELDGDESNNVQLMIGRSRDIGRDSIANSLAPFRTGAQGRMAAKPTIVVATQCLEVGVDLDLDGLVTQAAPIDALRQRFGRLNRAGRPIDAGGTIIALSEDVAKRNDDPVYGDRIRRTWEALGAIAENGIVDFGVQALTERLKEAELDPNDLASVRPDAPTLMPAYLNLWSQTSPRPTLDPEVGLFLHGAERKSVGVSIVWRSDFSEADLVRNTTVDLNELIRLVPPRAAEVIELPLWDARAWLSGSKNKHTEQLSDAPQREPETHAAIRIQAKSRLAFRWAGHDDPDTGVVKANELRPGDLILVPDEYGGCDSFGWAPEFDSRVVDVADEAAKPYWGRRCAVRVAPGFLRQVDKWDRISDVLSTEDLNGLDLVNRLLAELPSETEEGNSQSSPLLGDLKAPLNALRLAKGRIDVHFPYHNGPNGGAILVAERGISEQRESSAAVPTTEDDTAALAAKRPVSVDDHGDRVASFTLEFAKTLGLEHVADDLHLAALLHDVGKADPRFQIMLAGGDPWNRPDGSPLAKSSRSWSPQAWTRAGLPRRWRHEALSVRMARMHPDLTKATDPSLVLWLIGSHHGRGRPFFEFHDPVPEKPLPCLRVVEWQLPDSESGPQSLGFDFGGADWPSLFEDLKRRYGIWRLAFLEAVLRLADHRASEEESAS